MKQSQSAREHHEEKGRETARWSEKSRERERKRSRSLVMNGNDDEMLMMVIREKESRLLQSLVTSRSPHDATADGSRRTTAVVAVAVAAAAAIVCKYSRTHAPRISCCSYSLFAFLSLALITCDADCRCSRTTTNMPSLSHAQASSPDNNRLSP